MGFNMPEEDIPGGETGLEQEEDVSTPEPGAGTEPSDDKPDKGPETDTDPNAESTPDFLNPSDKEKVEGWLAQHPEMKPMVDTLHEVNKNMQRGFTKAMQGIPKEYRSSEAIQNLVAENARLKQELQGKPQAAAQGKDTEPTKPTPAYKAKLDALLKDASEETKEWFNQVMPIFEAMAEGKAEEKVKPFAERTANAEEAQAKKDLSEKYKELVMDDFWPEIQQVRKKYPDMSHEDALTLAIRKVGLVDEKGNKFTDIREYYRSLGKTEALSNVPKPGKGKFVVGGYSSVKTGTHSQADIDKMTPEEFAAANNIHRLDED